MCGHVGILGPGITHWDIDILGDLSHMIALRGMEGSGIVQGRMPYYGDKIENLILEKSEWDIVYFKQWHRLHKDGNRDLFKGINNNFFCVHARWPTIGSVSKENSHPFDVGRYIGLHNGTLKDKKYQRDDMTDSEAMFRDMNERGIQTVLSELDKDSAYAVVILDKETQKIYFARNYKRTLYFCFNSKRSVMYWASEKWMLEGSLERNNESVKDNTYWYFSPDVLYELDPTEIPKKVEGIPKIDLKSKTVVHKDNSVKGVIKDWHNHNKGKKKPVVRVKAQQRNEDVGNPRIKIPAMFCCACQKPLNLVEQYFAKKFGKNAVLCDSCDSQENLVVVH